jgi:L-iditol 2-dehydrogenase
MASRAQAAVLGGADLMKAHVLVRPGQLELRDLPMPHPDRDGIVVRVRAALTCGTDLKTYLRGHPKFAMPMLFGHEFAGEVAAIGAEVRGLREGDAVMVAPTAPCGNCYYCTREQENLCPAVMPTMVHGAYAEFIRVPGAVVRVNLYEKPAELPYREAALLEPLACVEHGLSFVRLRPDDSVVVVGGGAITLLHLLALRARGCERVMVVARNPRRADEARRMGAAAVVQADVSTVRERVLDWTAGRGADVVVECTGQVDVWEAVPALARVGGQVVFFGGCTAGSTVRFDTARLHYDQVQVFSPFHFTPRDVRRAFELLASGRLCGAGLIAGEHSLEDLPVALDQLRAGGGPKYAIVPNGR